MKKFLLSILCLLGIVAVQAQTKTYTYDFSSNTNWVTEAGGTTNVATGSGNKLNAFYYAETGEEFNAGGNGYFNSGYFLWGKSGAYIELPTYEGEVITNVTAHSSTGHSKSVNVNVYTTDGTAASTELTWSTTDSDYSYDIASDYQSSALRLQVTNAKNSQIVSLTITTQSSASGATLALPTSNVATGTIYNPADVELSAEAGTIYYTLDGTDPTAESTVYSGAISVSEFGAITTIKAVAIDGEAYSDVATFSYNLKVATPTMNYNTGVYEKIKDLQFATETTSATIRYIRVNSYNTDPKNGSKFYGYSLGVYSTGEYQAIAFVVTEAGDTIWSDVVSKKFYISPIVPFKATTEIVSGEKYLIGCGEIIADHLYESKTYGYLYDKDVTVNGEFIETNQYYGFTFTESETAGEYYIQDVFGRYLYMAGTYTSFQVSADEAILGDSALWTVEFDDDFTATITNKGKGNVIEYSSNYGSYGAYATSTGEKPILYGEIEYPTFTVTPANYETVPTLAKITVTCKDGISSNEEKGIIPYYNISTDWNYTPYYFEDGVQIDENTIEFTLETEITENGDYRVVLPAGLFTLYPGGLNYASEEMYCNYTVNNPNVLNVVYSNPQNDATVKSIEYLMFQYSHDITSVDVNDAVITDGDGNTYSLTVSDVDAWGDPVATDFLCLKTAEPITTPGEYTFVLKSEYAANSIGTKLSEDITYTFTLVEGLKLTSISPVEGEQLTSVSELVLSFNKAVCHDYISQLSVSDESGNVYTFTKDAETEYKAESVRFVADTPITAAGVYSFTLESYMVYCYDANWSMEVLPTETHTFTFSGSEITNGIDAVVNGNIEGEKVIYDITGRRVKEITTPGIYIINGVKTIVR